MANYIHEMSHQFVTDVKILERNMAMLSYPRVYHEELKKFTKTNHHEFFGKVKTN